MAISDRQAAAIRRRKQDKEADRRMAEERARLALVVPATGDQGPVDQAVALVGWRVQDGSLKGAGHVCITCSPNRDPGQVPVLRMQLAARSKCTQCGTVLETVVLEGVTGTEKK